jgi:hypothetical protein
MAENTEILRLESGIKRQADLTSGRVALVQGTSGMIRQLDLSSGIKRLAEFISAVVTETVSA